MMIQGETGNRLTGFYRGEVVARSGSGYGKCKVYIPGVYPEWSKDVPTSLPDCEQAAPLFAGINNGNGMFSYPNIGAIVWCFFANGDQNYPVYFAATLGAEDAGGQFSSCEPFPEIDMGAYFHKICCGGSQITMSELGNVVIENHSVDQNTMEPTDTVIVMDQSGRIQIKATSSIQIRTPQLKLDAEKSIEIHTGEFSLSCDNRHSTTSPYFNVKTNYDGVENGNNAINLESDTINLKADEGYINANSSTNGGSNL